MQIGDLRSAGILTASLTLLALFGSVAHGQAPRSFHCGQDILLTWSFGELPAAGLRLAEAGKTTTGATIQLNAGPGLANHSAALAAWQGAVQIWENVLRDPVAIVIQGDLQSLPPNVLGSTNSRTFSGEYAEIRDALVADAAADEGIATLLPALANFNLLLPPGFVFPAQLSATKANLRALGFDMSFDDAFPDAIILFATGFLENFDFDPSDGIDPDKIDFEAVVVHEIGHALGFSSRVDQVDFLRFNGQTGAVRPTSLDLFRLRPGEGAVNFTLSPRLVSSGDLEPVHMFFDGSHDLGLSTGVNLGDGRQASHWKGDEFTGEFIGIMDPSLSDGVREELTENDIRAFGLIGWDVSDPAPTDVPPDGQVPSPVVLEAAYPNPFNPRVKVAFALERAGTVRLEVYDLQGRKVRTLVSGERPAGRHEVEWDGRNDASRQVASGVYLLRLSAFGIEVRTKLVLAK